MITIDQYIRKHVLYQSTVKILCYTMDYPMGLLAAYSYSIILSVFCIMLTNIYTIAHLQTRLFTFEILHFTLYNTDPHR